MTLVGLTLALHAAPMNLAERQKELRAEKLEDSFERLRPLATPMRWSTGCDPAKRFTRLAEFDQANALTPELAYLTRALEALGPSARR